MLITDNGFLLNPPLGKSDEETVGDRLARQVSDSVADRCIVFLHVPKTAGRTVRSSLLWNFPMSKQIHLDILDRPLEKEMERIPEEKRLNARLVWGHIPFGVHRYIPRPCDYFTVLREPVGRVISVYKYILRTNDHVLHDRVVGERVPLEEYLKSGMDEGQTENSQTRQLSGRQFGALSQDALEEAKRNLETCLVVGLTERFEETFVLLRRTLRLRTPFYITRNVSPAFQASERAVELIRERNELDLELYAFARDLFAGQLSRQNRSFGLEVSAFRALRPLSGAAGERTQRLLRKVLRRRRRMNTSRH